MQRGSFVLPSHLIAHPPPQLGGTGSGVHSFILCPFCPQRLTYGVPALRRAVFWGLGRGYDNILPSQSLHSSKEGKQ